MSFNLNSKAGQFTIWNFFRMVKSSHFLKALLAQYNAILGLPSSPLCYGYAENRVFFSQADILATSSTPSTPSIFSVLSKSSTVGSSPSESHNNTPSKYTWARDPYWWYYCSDNVKTGIAIDKITRLKITPYQTIKLAKPSFRILFYPPNDERIYHMVEYPSLEKAKKIAEWYYSEWLKVNHKLITR